AFGAGAGCRLPPMAARAAGDRDRGDGGVVQLAGGCAAGAAGTDLVAEQRAGIELDFELQIELELGERLVERAANVIIGGELAPRLRRRDLLDDSRHRPHAGPVQQAPCLHPRKRFRELASSRPVEQPAPSETADESQQPRRRRANRPSGKSTSTSAAGSPPPIEQPERVVYFCRSVCTHALSRTIAVG